jgi:hypothetical protein
MSSNQEENSPFELVEYGSDGFEFVEEEAPSKEDTQTNSVPATILQPPVIQNTIPYEEIQVPYENTIPPEIEQDAIPVLEIIETKFDEADTVITILPDPNPTVLEPSNLRGRKNYSTFKDYLKGNFKGSPMTSSFKCKCRGCFECFRILFRPPRTPGELLRLNKKL